MSKDTTNIISSVIFSIAGVISFIMSFVFKEDSLFYIILGFVLYIYSRCISIEYKIDKLLDRLGEKGKE